jgi:hypothetical protein
MADGPLTVVSLRNIFLRTFFYFPDGFFISFDNEVKFVTSTQNIGDPTTRNQEISPLQDARNCDMELSPDFLVRCVLDCGCPLSFAEGGAFRLGVAQPRAARGAPPPRPRKFLRSCWAGARASGWDYQEGQIGQKMVRFGSLRPTRSRQDESIEVGEVGSKRPSSGGTGGHVVWCSGLIFWLLLRLSGPAA